MTDNPAQLNLSVKRIVLKDLSFETPMGQVIFEKDWQPDYKVKLQLRSASLSEGIWEVIVMATVTASLEGSVAFLVEAQQAGVFEVTATNIDTALDSEAVRKVLSIEAPELIFPYLREAVDSVAGKGGFPQVRMQPGNFKAWYEDAQWQDESPDDEDTGSNLADEDTSSNLA